MVSLGRDTDPRSVREAFPKVKRLSDGFYGAILQGGYEIGVYEPSGGLVDQLGGRGEGPGEFMYILTLEPTPGGGLAAFDYTRQVALFSADRSFFKAMRIPVSPQDAVVFGDGSSVLAGMLSSTDRAGLPLQYVSPDGELIRSFGAEKPVVDPNRPSANQRWIARASEASVWTVRPDRYELEEWNVDGRRVRQLVATEEWFPPRDYELGPLDGRPDSWIRDIQTDEDGRIWILAATADPNWRDSRFVRGKDPITAEQLDEHYDSIVQVLDPAGATILASERFPTHFWAFAGAGFVFRIASDEAGEVRAEVWRVELVVQ